MIVLSGLTDLGDLVASRCTKERFRRAFPANIAEDHGLDTLVRVSTADADERLEVLRVPIVKDDLEGFPVSGERCGDGGGLPTVSDRSPVQSF